MSDSVRRGILNNRGLSLIELLVTMAITGIVMTLVVKMFISMSTGYTTQTGRADLQQSVRAVMDLLVREIRMAGFTSHSVDGFGISRATEQEIAFTVDWDDNGLVSASHSDDPLLLQESDLIAYSLGEDGSLRRTTAEGTPQESSQALVGGTGDWMQITDLAFNYFDHDGRETSIPADIRSVSVSITAATPAGRKKMVEQAYRTRIKCRNLGM